METNREVGDPMIIVEKEAVVAAWKWYEHHLNIAATLFTIDPDFPTQSIVAPSPTPRSKTLKQLIMLLDFNIFPLSAISVKHPSTGQTYVQWSSTSINELA